MIVYTPIILGVKRTNYGKFSLQYRGAENGKTFSSFRETS